jgi:hypothetical protein
MPGGRDDAGVQRGVALGVAEQVVLVQFAVHPLQGAAQPGDIPGGGVHRGLPGGEALEDRARLKNLDRLRLTDQFDPGAAVGRQHDDAVLAEAHQRGAHHSPADSQPGRQVCLDEPFVGVQFAAVNERA